MKSRWIVLAITLGGCRRSPPEKVDQSPAGSGSSVTIPFTSEIDARAPGLIDDMIAFPAGAARGRLLTCDHEHKLSETAEPVEDSPFSVTAFEIDRRTVSCVDYGACVDSKVCRSLDDHGECNLERAVVRYANAAAYCRWRGARLPSYAEWQRAVRGSEGRLYVTGSTYEPKSACTQPTSHDPAGDHEGRGCQQVSSDGVMFSTRSLSGVEWTGDEACILVQGNRETGRAGVFLLDDRLDLMSIHVHEGEFRCARNRAP